MSTVPVEKWGHTADPESLTAFIRGSYGPEDRARRWAVAIRVAVADWHASLDAVGYEAIGTPRAETMWRRSPYFECNLLGLIVTGRVVPKGSLA